MIAALGLVVSHTFWFNAVLAEVYALNSLITLWLLDAVLGCCDHTPKTTGQAIRWTVWGCVAGLACGNHGLVLLWMPGLAWILFRRWRSGWLPGSHLILLISGWVAGMVPIPLLRSMKNYADTAGDIARNLASAFLDPAGILSDIGFFLGYLLYQFPVPLLIVASLIGVTRIPRETRVGLLLIYGINVLFAFRFPANDRFAFYLPSYLIVALMAAPGLDRIQALLPMSTRSLRPYLAAVMAVAVVALPPVIYHFAPFIIGEMVTSKSYSIRNLPGRNAARYYLDPDKREEQSARQFAEDVLNCLEPNAVVIADLTMLEPIRYLKVVEKIRPDVRILYVPPPRQLETILAESDKSPVYLAARNRYYDIPGISMHFRLVPRGPIFRLDPRTESL